MLSILLVKNRLIGSIESTIQTKYLDPILTSQCKVYLEEGNKYDLNAMKIVMPHSVPDGMLQMVTREGDSHRPAQKVKDILGK